MSRKLWTLACAVCVSASMLTGCGLADDDGNTRANNVNDFTDGRDNGIIDNGNGMPGPAMNRDNGNYELDGGRDVGANGAGVSGTSDAPGVIDRAFDDDR